MNKKGQALVEFVLVLPILIFILLAVIDVGKLMIMKNHLETVLGTVDKNTTEIHDQTYNITIERRDNYVYLKSCINVITPGMNRVLGNPACVETSKEEKE